MKLLKTYLLACAVLGLLAASSGTCRAQSDLELATYYYNSGAFEQARLYLDNLWKKDPSVYEMYLNTLLELEDYDEAEDIVKARLKKSRDKSMAQVDLGSLYLRIGRDAEAETAFRKALQELPEGRGPTKRLAEAFINNRVWRLKARITNRFRRQLGAAEVRRIPFGITRQSPCQCLKRG